MIEVSRKLALVTAGVLFALAVVALQPARIEGQAAVNTIYNRCSAVTTSDTVDLPLFSNNQFLTGAIYVGGAGNVVAVWADGTTSTFTAPPVGSILPIGVRRINSTNTTATVLLACYRF